MLKGKQTWEFSAMPVITGSAAVGGPFEGEGPLAKYFDILHDDIWVGQDSFEKAETKMFEQACEKAISKAGQQKDSINFFVGGDLLNQITSSSFAARTLAIPYIGTFGACSTSMESLAIAAQLVDTKSAQHVLAATASHNAAIEKQFRYPTEYGAQKPPTAQWTVTGAGAAVVSAAGQGPKITSATIGKVVDMGIKDPYNMGAAMAPAAVDTIMTHFKDLNRSPDYYDLIATGDLGRVGYKIASDLLAENSFKMPAGVYTDCGILIYDESQPVMAGGSGCACSATVTYGHFLNRMIQGGLKKILVVATGALLSPLSYQQKESIPCVAHAVAIEM